MKNRRSCLTALSLIWFLWDVKEPTSLFKKSRTQTPVLWSTFTHHSHHGLGRYSKLTNGLRADTSGAFVCGQPSLYTVHMLCKRACLLSSHPRLFISFHSSKDFSPLLGKFPNFKLSLISYCVNGYSLTGPGCSKVGQRYPPDKQYQDRLRYPLDSDLSSGQRYSPFKQPGPGLYQNLKKQ